MRKISTTQERLKIIMQEKNLRQIDVLALVQPYCQRYGITMSQSLFCQYCNGTRAPKPDRLIVLAKALNVHEDWLAGYDVARDSGEAIDSSLPEDLELPLKDLFRVFEILGYTLDKTDNGYFIQKGDFKAFVYST